LLREQANEVGKNRPSEYRSAVLALLFHFSLACCPGPGFAQATPGKLVQRHLWLVTQAGKDFESEVKRHSIISDIAYIALTAGRQLPSHSERPETPFL
jgi:hypothetical protein